MLLRSLCLALVSASFIVACGKNSKNNTSGETPAASSTTWGMSDVAKSWTSNCTTAATAEPITGVGYYKVYLTLNADGSYTSNMAWYSSSSCAGQFTVYYSTLGTYTLADISGSTTQKLATFTMTFSVPSVTPDVMVVGNATRTSFNNDCGGTSPYTGGANATDGSHQYTGTLNCMSATFPNSSLRNKFYNLLQWDGTNFYVGAHYTGESNVPGSFTVNTVAATPSIYMH